MTVKKYMSKLRRHLHVDKKTKTRIVESLCTEIQIAMDKGESLETILTRMGSAYCVAKDYNASYKDDPQYKKSRKYYVAKHIAIIALMVAILVTTVSLFMQVSIMSSSYVSQVGGVSGPSSVETTSQAVGIIYYIKKINIAVPISLVVFVLSSVYCIFTKIKKKKADDDVVEKK